MKKEILLASAIGLGVGACHGSPAPKGPESASNPQEGCALFVHQQVKEIEYSSHEPHYSEVTDLDRDIRNSLQKACESYYDLTGDYPGMK